MRIVLLSVAAVFGALLLIGVIGAAFGLGKQTPTAAAAAGTSSVPTIHSAPQITHSAVVETSAHAQSSRSIQPAPKLTTAKPSPGAKAKPSTDLVFTGAVTASAETAVDVLPAATTSNFGSGGSSSAPWATKCVFDGDGTTAWSATVVVKTPGNEWSISISNAQSFGNPSPGAYVGIEHPEANFPSNAVSLSVESTKPIASYLTPDANNGTDYGYYTPLDRDNGNGNVALNRGLMSGALDVWLTPIQPTANLVFHITGTWSCA